jgi:hypothetical protein
MGFPRCLPCWFAVCGAAWQCPWHGWSLLEGRLCVGSLVQGWRALCSGAKTTLGLYPVAPPRPLAGPLPFLPRCHGRLISLGDASRDAGPEKMQKATVTSTSLRVRAVSSLKPEPDKRQHTHARSLLSHPPSFLSGSGCFKSDANGGVCFCAVVVVVGNAQCARAQ